MMTTFPGTKTYFAHLDIRPRSPHLLSHGKTIVLAIAECSKDISSMMVTLAPLQTLHAYQLRIDPCNFKLLSHCILVTLAAHMGDEFTPVAHAAMDKMMTTFPGTKTYFAHLDIRPRSPHLLSHGKTIFLAIAECSKDISSIMVTLALLQTLHAYQLRIDPCNFKLLSHCILLTLAAHMGDEFTPVAHAAMDKYLSAFAAVLAEKYR
ncbi:unnamed protein product, partial [Coregonus sp. 'balchen']